MTNMNYREYSALMSAVNVIMNGRTVSIEENSDWRSDVKKFGVNWACCGTQKIEEAKKFAEQINKACKIVEKLNAMKINVNYDTEGKTDREAYKSLITKYMDELQG
jgi:hypothetical protein